MDIMNILVLALMIEAVVSVLKPLWSDESRMSVAEMVSLGIGVLLAVTCRIDLMAYVTDWTLTKNAPGWVQYVFYAMSGIALGRGPSFLWDLWQRIREISGGKPPDGAQSA